ncbi:hypothetical protein BRYFOR_07483 [Marvinbryantia formatexigens DSM 14469]|uniref:Uncharacterized protein n=1 Tax=Marvinbryantia formatexigens DSM 14469 TaxID=478749 RepID=C6LFS3_9FIRM|nr:hypothetical protein BRYFOR_07483 [Marvinbryantia formatexigens DSM 14469]
MPGPFAPVQIQGSLGYHIPGTEPAQTWMSRTDIINQKKHKIEGWNNGKDNSRNM